MLARLSLLFAGHALGGETETAAGASVAEAREALAFWRNRLSRLAWHRRAARREARIMVSRSRARLVRAHLRGRRLGSLHFALEPLVVMLGRSRRDHIRWLGLVVLRRTLLARWRLLAVATLAVGSLTALALFAIVAGRLLGF